MTGARAGGVLYQGMEAGLKGVAGVQLIPRPQAEDYVGSSFQFLLPGWEPARVARFVAGAAARGVELKWFGAADPQGFTSRYAHWRYAAPEVLPQTDRVLAGLIDMRSAADLCAGRRGADCPDHRRRSGGRRRQRATWHPSRHLWRTEPWRSLVRRGQWAVWHGCCGG
jgi:hypothetical protein